MFKSFRTFSLNGKDGSGVNEKDNEKLKGKKDGDENDDMKKITT